MKILIVEDDFICRSLMQKMLSAYGDCDLAVNGEEAVDAFEMAHREGTPYRLICLDIMMPEMDGHQVVKAIRRMERDMKISPKNEAKVIMTTALDSPKEVVEAYYRGGCTDYLVKPVEKDKLLELMREYKLVA